MLPDYATNLRRVMATLDLTTDDVVAATGLDQRTVKGLLRGSGRRPHARMLHKLAAGLGVSADEFFQNPSSLRHRLFDRRTNTVVDDLVATSPNLFDGWNENDFDELYSRFGTGGGLTPEGTRDVVRAMNRKRDIHGKVDVLLESSQAEVLAGIIELLYEKVQVEPR